MKRKKTMYYIIRDDKGISLKYINEISVTHAGLKTPIDGVRHGFISNSGRFVDMGQNFRYPNFSSALEDYEKKTDVVYKSEDMDEITHKYLVLSELCD